MIAAVATILSEADIIGRSIEHLLASGVDRIYIALSTMSDDGTDVILKGFPEVEIVPDGCPYHDQPARTAELSALATADGATWVIPFDADEFVYAPEYDNIPDALADVPDGINKLGVTRWQHKNWDYRHINAEQLPKVAWRAGLPIVCKPGNHDVDIAGGGRWLLYLRELSFRSYEHMARKCVERVVRIDPTFGPEMGAHQRRLAALAEPDLRAAWDAMQQIPTVYDPIPARTR